MRRWLFPVLAWVLCSTAGVALATPAEPTTEVIGVVVDAAGQAVHAAEVSAPYIESLGTVATDAVGKFYFTIPALQVPGLTLLATHSMQVGVLRVGWQHRPGQPLEAQRIQLQPTTSVRVSVADRAGQALAGARVGAIVDHLEMPRAQSDAMGTATLLVPAGLPLQAVYAYQPGVGFDYCCFDSEESLGPAPAGPLEETIALRLASTRKVQILARDVSGQPVAGVNYFVWLLRKPGSADWFNVSTARDLFRVTTDAEGIARFDHLPVWNEFPLTFRHTDPRFASNRVNCEVDPAGDRQIETTLLPVVPLAGQVVLADGSPAAGILVRVDGTGPGGSALQRAILSQADGRFSLDVDPYLVYAVSIDDLVWSAPVVDGFAVDPQRPTPNLRVVLQPATKVHGRLMVGPEQRPLANQVLNLLRAGRSARVVLPPPDGAVHRLSASVSRQTTTDAEGRYAFHVGPGNYKLIGVSQIKPQPVRVTDQTEVVLDLLTPRLETGPLAGTVVDARTGQPVAMATIEVAYDDTPSWKPWHSDDQGHFQIERRLHPAVLVARSADGLLAGMVELGPDDAQAAIQLQPLCEATGQLWDEASDLPLLNQEMRAGVRMSLGGANPAFYEAFTQQQTTDGQGSFRFTALVAGARYHLTIRLDGGGLATVGEVTCDEPGPRKLGTLLVPRPYRLPTDAEETAQALAGDPGKKLNAARKAAAEYRQQVAVVFVDPLAISTQDWFKLWNHNDNLRDVIHDYQLVVVDGTALAGRQLAEELTVRCAATEQFPQIVACHADGSLLGSATRVELSRDNAIDRRQLETWLRRHALPRLDGQKLLAEALAEAQRSNRRVLVQETAVWCGPCHRLEHFLEQRRSLWEGDYIWLRLDQRWSHVPGIVKAWKPQELHGIPWLAILDAQGQLLATSTDTNGANFSIPTTAEERDQLVDMIRRTAQRLSAADLATLRRDLQSLLPSAGSASP